MNLVKSGSFSDAVTAIGKAIEKNPKDTAALSLRAFAWSALGDRDKAMADYNEAIRLDPKNWGLYVSRATVWQGQREYDKAIADYSEAIRLAPKNGRLYTNRASVLNEKGEYDKALDDLKEAVRLDPKDVYALVNRAAAEHGKGQFEKVIADLKEAIRLDPSVPDAYNGLAWLQATCPDARLRDGHEAYKNAKRAYLMTNATNASYIDTLAASYAEVGDFEAACKWQAKAINLLMVEKDKEEGRSRLELYKKAKPYREDPAAR
jgi:tetratricopeptide (TPR) repeat protein